MERIKTSFRRLKLRIKRGFSRERIFFSLAVLACLAWTFSAISAMSRNWELEQRLVAKRYERDILQLEIESLELENRYYASEEYQELAARARQNKIGEGETLIYLPDNSDYAKHKHDGVTVEEAIEEPANYEQWFTFIFGS